MTLHICNNCPITKDDCGPWDDQHELFKTVFTIHKNHLGFQKIESKKTLVDHSRYVDLDLMLHKLISHEKGFTKSCLIAHKPWREIENWEL